MEFRSAMMEQKLKTPAGPAAAPPSQPVAAAVAPAPAAVAPAATPVAPVASPSDDAETLKRLADLRDSGAISAEDYEAKKTEILARM